ncbi:MAG: cobalamin-independent methionine synthase II family protein [Gammaproteobacteria bacterium]
MLIASKDKPLATTITGSLPRPSWFTQNLQGRPIANALSDLLFREQYIDALATYVSDQVRAGIDILTDGDARFDMDVGGRSWFSYMSERIRGTGPAQMMPQPWTSPREQTAGDILHEVNETRLPSKVVGPISRGDLQYPIVWKVAQRMTNRHVKLGTCCGQLLEAVLINEHYKDRPALIDSMNKAMNEEYHALADAGCPAIQLEEPLIHYVASAPPGGMDAAFYVKAFNAEVAGLRKKTEVWVHTCWGNPAAQKVEVDTSYEPALPFLNQLDVDVITFETASDGGAAYELIGRHVSKEKKVCIGVVNHRTLQVETPEQVAALIRKALKHIEPQRLILGTDCGFGRQGMSRMHAFFKMVSIVKGTNIVRKELGIPEAECLAGDAKFKLL